MMKLISHYSEEATMDSTTISEARKFSLKSVQRSSLVTTTDLQMELICFEAGQRDNELSYSKTCVYQVLEGELLIKQNDVSKRFGKGKLLTIPALEKHTLENAGGGLLVVMATRAIKD
jgi:mannose-6-phosphate isomerase-like protein (cupin superfamily)